MLQEKAFGVCEILFIPILYQFSS